MVFGMLPIAMGTEAGHEMKSGLAATGNHRRAYSFAASDSGARAGDVREG